MDDATAEKIARNNSVFRDANEGIAGAATEHGLDVNRPTPFICECSDPKCTRLIPLSLLDYRRVRSDPRWFVHARGHEAEIPGVVALVEENEDYLLVQKIGHAGDVATDLAESRGGE
jgi:hypothetical protein